tara:strand:+ start:85 stop:717 length:633 start_codon:yes stop_codon:yes gene_type:complete
MKTINHEGKEYILKSEVDNIVTSRISKISESRRTTQGELDTLQAKFDSMQDKIKGVDALHNQIATLQDDLTHSNTRYSRHSAIANHGITNPEVRDLVEWQYSKAMDGRAKKNHQTMGDWLDGMKQEGADVPHILKPYLSEQPNPVPSQSAPQATPVPQAKPVPQSNNGVHSTSEKLTSQGMMTKANDYEYYQKNRAKIKEMYYQKRGRSI